MLLCFNIQSQILENTLDIKINNGKRITTRSVTIQINNKNQQFLGEVEIPFQEGNDPQILEAVILNSDNRVVRSLKKKDIEIRSRISSISFYEDDYVKSFNLYASDYPYKIRYSYKHVENDYIYTAWWYPIMAFSTPHINNTLTLECPSEYTFETSSNFDFQYSVDESEGIQKHTWSSKNLYKKSLDDNAPNWRESLPYVLIAPKSFNYSIAGEADSWESYGDWIYKLNKGKYNLTFNEEKIVDELIKNVSDTIEIIRILYNHLQKNTKYVNVSIEEGGLEPYPASYVCYNKYGDCKALTIYMMALLKHAGINSNYSLVNAGIDAADIIDEIPGPQFNHVILGVPLKSDTIWLENTSKTLPFNYLGTFTQNKKTLWIKENESVLIQTPKMSLEDFKESRQFDFILNENGNGQLVISESFGGRKFERFLPILESEDELYDAANLYANSSSFEFKSVEVDLISSDNKIQLKTEYSCQNQLRKVGNLIALTPPKIQTFPFEIDSRREQPFMIYNPINRQWKIDYQLDTKDYSIEFPKNITLNSKYGEFSMNFSMADGELRIDQEFILFAQILNKEDFSPFQEFLDKIESLKNKSSILLK